MTLYAPISRQDAIKAGLLLRVEIVIAADSANATAGSAQLLQHHRLDHETISESATKILEKLTQSKDYVI